MLSQIELIQQLQPGELEQIQNLVSRLSSQQQLWLSGYLAGLAGQAEVVSQPQTISHSKLTVLYGSQTGNARRLAEDYAAAAAEKQISAQPISLADYKPRNISKEEYIVLIISTHGEGDPPDDAELFYEYLFSDKAAQLNHVKYSVLSLGDSSYEFFCKTGADFDARFAELGAEAIVARIDCDLDFETEAAGWRDKTLDVFEPLLKVEQDQVSNIVPLNLPGPVKASEYHRNNPFAAEVLTVQKITGSDSIKNVFHIELSLEESGLKYKPGDSLGVIVENDVGIVSSILDVVNADENTQVEYKGETVVFNQLLSQRLELTLLDKAFLNFYAEFTGSQELQQSIASHADFKTFVKSRQLIDVLQTYPSVMTAQQLADQLRPLTPRLYSIASSQLQTDDEVHLTVALHESSHNDHDRYGAASSFLCQRLQAGDQVQVYVEPNNNFRLPESGEAATIMIGPGTGVAPFRAFLQERDELQHDGANWLLFGNPNFEQDFLYQLEWQALLKSGVLNRIDLAFSRDQAEKIYVQHRLQEQAELFWQWLETGAYVYVCGDADRMAKDVETTILNIIVKQGGLSDAAAVAYLKDMKAAKRYQKDVY
ncbi:assimilatory sulfite reductase (NADPH) flavoprotein subunit [Marinicella sp. W31]|uniref:assimilatory sulfite reductase (NADPH) flavoprotein subunit n=1 Tax=Marinicella sp. W31 TaxID=3023713 RepID=UPI003757D4C1